MKELASVCNNISYDGGNFFAECKECKKSLDSFIDRYKKLIDDLNPDRGKTLISIVTEIKTFMNDFATSDVATLMDYHRKTGHENHEKIFHKVEVQIGFLQESVRLLECTIGMQSYYEHEVAIGDFEPSKAKREHVNIIGGYFKVTREFLFEDSDIPNSTLNYDLDTPNGFLTACGIPVIVKKATDLNFERSQNVLRYGKNLLEGVLRDHPNIVQVIPREGGGDTMVMRDAGTRVLASVNALCKEEAKW